MCMWTGFAIFAATAWERISNRWQIAGAAAIGILGIVIGLVARLQPHFRKPGAASGSWTTWDAIQMLPPSAWPALQRMLEVIAISLIVASAVALFLAVRNRPLLCLAVLAIGMIPIGLSLADGIARMSPQFSLANAARALEDRLKEKDAVVYEGDLDDASSLVFYLHRTFYLVNQPRNDEMHIPGGKDITVNEDTILRHWGDPQGIFLIIKQERVPYWQQLLTDRFHIYHQVATSGSHVVLTNQL